MFEALGVISGLVAAFSYIPYGKDILAKKVRPERASWLIWCVLAGIAFFSQLSKGATQSLWFTGLDSIGAFITFVLAIKYGMGGLKRRDTIALILAVVGLVVWYFTHNALWALLITIGIDAVGATLTVWKTVEDPTSETYPMWVIVSIAAVIAMISVGKWNPILIVYPFYIFLANFSVVLALYIGRHKVKHGLAKASSNA